MVSFKDRRVHRVIIGLQSFMEGISLNVRLDFAFFLVGHPPQHLVEIITAMEGELFWSL